jgi:iron complex outermembrane receptor protein
MNFKRNLLSEAVRFGIAAGAVSLLGLTPAFAQDDTEEETAELERIEVTGSRIKRADVEGALPVTVIDRQELELSGDNSVADFLRNTTFNSFGSFRPQSGSSAQSVAQISLRGLGAGRTLLLLDGRRIPTAPSTGQGQDLNMIPLASVERIEILSDGASAIYGSDAIGGVINIITRKDFNGVELTVGMGDPKRTGGETEEGSAIFGISGDRGSMIGGMSYNNRGIIFQRDRPWSAGGVSSYSNELYAANPSPGSFFGFTPGSRINGTQGLGPSVIPAVSACSGPGFTRTATRCFYDFTFVAADEAEQRNESLFMRGTYQINDDWSTYLSASVQRVKSFGRYAPTPSSPWLGGAQPFIPVGSPNHPATVFPTAGYNPNVPYFFRHRFAASANRDTFIDANTYNFLLGAEGQLGDFYLDFGVRSSESRGYEKGLGIVGSIAQQFISNGTYNIYDPFNNSSDVLQGMVATVPRDNLYKVEELFGTASTDLWEMGGGAAGVAFGVEFRSEEYADNYDSLTETGQIVGGAGNSAGGGRNVKSAFGELLMPVLSNLEVSLAARYDEYSDYGNDTSPKLSVRWQPFESLTLRGSIGKGFRAPTLDIITAQPSFSADGISHPETCLSQGQPAGCATQVNAYVIANPNVASEQSDQFSVGLAWDATDWLSMTVDYYDIKVTDRVAQFTSARIVNCLEGAGTLCPPGLSVLPSNISPPQPSLGLGAAFGPDGEILFVQRGAANLGEIEIDGIDVNFRTNFDFGDWGSLENQLQIGYVGNYSLDGGDSLIGLAEFPEYRASLINQWAYGDFAFGWTISFIDSTNSTCFDTQDLDVCVDYGYPLTVPSFVTHDVQATWNTPWNGRLTLGVQNLSDRDPSLDALHEGGRGFAFNLYDAYGRVPYVRYTQNF